MFMRSLSIMLVFLWGMALPCASLCAESRAVLLISSYHPGFPTFFQQIEGMKSVLDPQGIGLDVEFLDAKRFGGGDNQRMFLERLRFKLSQIPPYAVVAVSDDAALQ
jgi:hypothetical protein